jgi:hypothetical protein
MPFEAIPLNDKRWDETLSKCPAGIFYTTRFCQFRVDGSHSHALMFRYHDDRGLVFDVTTVKDISSLPFFSTVSQDFPHLPIDIESPEYNGPVIVGAPDDEHELLSAYRAAVDAYCEEHNVVTEFVRVHPMSSIAGVLTQIVPLTSASDMVYVDLRHGYEAARSNYSSKRRQEMNRAVRNGARIRVVQPEEDAILRCSALYNDTMRRKAAKSVRIFEADYCVSLFGHLGENAILVEAFMGDALASSTVLLLDGKNIWASYTGTVYSLRDSDANLYMTDRMIAWAAERGYDYFLLGGGIEPGDGMYAYKMRFSKLMSSVRHLRKVHQPGLLQFLLGAKCEYDRCQGRTTRLDYFPSYWLA